MERIGDVKRMIRPKPMFWIILGGIAIWYFLIMYPITTILTIVSVSVIIGLTLRYRERNK